MRRNPNQSPKSEPADALIKVSVHGHLRGGVGQPRAGARRSGARSSTAAHRVKRGLVPIGVGRRAHPRAGRIPAGCDPDRAATEGESAGTTTGSAWRCYRGGCSVLGVCRRSPLPWGGRGNSRKGAGAGTRRRATWPAGVAAHGFDREQCSTAPSRSYNGSRKGTYSNPESFSPESLRPLCRQSNSELAEDPLRDVLQHCFHSRRLTGTRDVDPANRSAVDRPSASGRSRLACR
jgi:hypothetical protein